MLHANTRCVVVSALALTAVKFKGENGGIYPFSRGLLPHVPLSAFPPQLLSSFALLLEGAPPSLLRAHLMRIDNTSDFIAPTQACVVALNGSKLDAAALTDHEARLVL